MIQGAAARGALNIGRRIWVENLVVRNNTPKFTRNIFSISAGTTRRMSGLTLEQMVTAIRAAKSEAKIHEILNSNVFIFGRGTRVSSEAIKLLNETLTTAGVGVRISTIRTLGYPTQGRPFVYGQLQTTIATAAETSAWARYGKYGFWGALIMGAGSGSATLGRVGATITSTARTGIGWGMWMEGIIMFAEFMKEEAVQTSQFGLMISSEDPEHLLKTLQHHYAILCLAINSRFLLKFNFNERAFSVFFLASLNTYIAYLYKLKLLLLSDLWNMNIQAISETDGTEINASIYINNQSQWAETPQERFTPIRSPKTQTVKVSLRATGYDEFVTYVTLLPSNDFHQIDRRLSRILLYDSRNDFGTSPLTYGDIGQYLRYGPLNEAFIDILRALPITEDKRKIDLLNSVPQGWMNPNGTLRPSNKIFDSFDSLVDLEKGDSAAIIWPLIDKIKICLDNLTFDKDIWNTGTIETYLDLKGISERSLEYYKNIGGTNFIENKKTEYETDYAKYLTDSQALELCKIDSAKKILTDTNKFSPEDVPEIRDIYERDNDNFSPMNTESPLMLPEDVLISLLNDCATTWRTIDINYGKTSKELDTEAEARLKKDPKKYKTIDDAKLEIEMESLSGESEPPEADIKKLYEDRIDKIKNVVFNKIAGTSKESMLENEDSAYLSAFCDWLTERIWHALLATQCEQSGNQINTPSFILNPEYNKWTYFDTQGEFEKAKAEAKAIETSNLTNLSVIIKASGRNISDDSPDLNFWSVGYWLSENKPWVFQTKHDYPTTIDATTYNPDMSIGPEWTFHTLTDEYTIEVIPTFDLEGKQTIVDNKSPIRLNRARRIEELISPQDVYSYIRPNQKTRWYFSDHLGNPLKNEEGIPHIPNFNNIPEENKLLDGTKIRLEDGTETEVTESWFIDKTKINWDYLLPSGIPKKWLGVNETKEEALFGIHEGDIDIHATMKFRREETHPIKYIVDCIDSAQLRIDNAETSETFGEEGITLNLTYGGHQLTTIAKGTERTTWINFNEYTPTPKGSPIPVIRERGFCDIDDSSKTPQKLKVIVNCVDNADIYLGGQYYGLSGLSTAGTIIDIPYGTYQGEFVYGETRIEKWLTFTKDYELLPGEEIPTFVVDDFCDELGLVEEECIDIPFIIEGVDSAAIFIDGELQERYYEKDRTSYCLRPGQTYFIRISPDKEEYYERTVTFYFDADSPFFEWPDGTKEKQHIFYYNFNSNKMSPYKQRDSYPRLLTNPPGAGIEFLNVETKKIYKFQSDEPIDMPEGDYILTVSADGYKDFQDKIHFDGFLRMYPERWINLDREEPDYECNC